MGSGGHSEGQGLGSDWGEQGTRLGGRGVGEWGARLRVGVGIGARLGGGQVEWGPNGGRG